MNGNRILSVGWIVAVPLILSHCKKDPGEGAAKAVEEAGYELSLDAYLRAVESNDLAALRSMDEAGFDLTLTDPQGRSGLHAAAGHDAIAVVDFLLEKGFEIDAADQLGRTPLMTAVVSSSPATVRHLLARGADPQKKDAKHYKPLMLAVLEGRADMVEVLSPYVRRDLNDALLAASILGQTEVIDELTNYGASVYARYEDGRTPLMLAAEYGHPETVDFLLAIGANRFAMDEQGRTAADLATGAGHHQLAQRLADAPVQGDFELLEPVELSESLLAQATPQPAPETSSNQPDESPVESDSYAPLTPSDPDQKKSVDSLSGATISAIISDQGATAPPHSTSSPTPSSPAKQPASHSALSKNPPVVMRAYRQKELPIQIESTSPDGAQIKIAGTQSTFIKKGQALPNTSLQLLDIKRRMRSGKTDHGAATDVSVVTLKDTSTEVTREFTVGVSALAHDPVALIEDTTTRQYYIARTGQKFHTADGQTYRVADVRANQVVIEHVDSAETTTLFLRGPRG